jgi:elongation factor Ts
MTKIPASLVKELRDKTGSGMMDCKKALTETSGELEAAVDWLRKKGLAAAAKKAGRIAAEGLVAVVVKGGVGAIVEINAETDFVARNEAFQEFVSTVAGIALERDGDAEALADAPYPEGGGTVGNRLTALIATIGENMALRRVARLKVGKGAVASYVHNASAPGLGKIGVLVALESDAGAGALADMGKNLAMHVAATNPVALSRDDVDPAEVERERDVLADQARASGKPEEIVEKMVEGRLRKYYQEVCLLEQTYVIDGETSVAKAVAAAAGDFGSTIEVAGFVRFALGEGIDRKEEDFASEVAAAAGA